MAKYTVLFEEDAKLDLADSYDWYTVISPLLANRFLREVKITIAYIEKRPEMFQKVHRDYWQAPLKKFPFVLLYKTDGSTINVYRVFHTRKNPETRFR